MTITAESVKGYLQVFLFLVVASLLAAIFARQESIYNTQEDAKKETAELSKDVAVLATQMGALKDTVETSRARDIDRLINRQDQLDSRLSAIERQR